MRFFIAALLAAALAAYVTLQTYSVFRVPPWKPRAYSPVTVWIPPGSSPKRMGTLLQSQGIIDSKLAFRLYTKLTQTDRLLKPGEYSFEAPTPIKKVVQDLVNENVVKWKITIPEGSTVKEILQVLKESKLEDKNNLETQLQDETFRKSLGLEGDSFEGFLFPDTYFFTRTTNAKAVVQTMVKRFFNALQPDDVEKAKQMGFSIFQWVTLASVIEKETGKVDEQPQIASVFHNRLKLGMRLQSDPTVIYGIPNYTGNITKKDLQTPTPYNTYTNKGLPKGPIANPGATALHAAVNPDQTEYLYFVSKGSGEHYFSKDYEEHKKAVSLYQLGKTYGPAGNP